MELQVKNILQQLGLGGAFAVIVIYLVLNFLKKHKKKEDQDSRASVSTLEEISEIQKKVESIHDILQVRDSDGTPLCYFPRSLSASIDNLAEAIREQTRMMHHFDLHLHEARDDIKDIQNTLRS